jgi:hypothetical protein
MLKEPKDMSKRYRSQVEEAFLGQMQDKQILTDTDFNSLLSGNS